MNTYIQLNRLIVLKSGKRVYDETYHSGLNIIYGSNGSGKSTIADLIFFSLGGDLTKWKEHASWCDEVIAEYNLSGTVITLKREIETKSLRPMRVFFGNIDDALNSAVDGWTLANFARDGGERRRSFSQILFETLGIPEIKGDGASNITMHQILRLMYVDQTSPFQRIFRAERFDAKDTREAVAELLAGIGGYELYSIKLERRKKKQELDKVIAKFSNLSQASIAFDDNINLDSIEGEIAVSLQKIQNYEQQLKEIDTSEIDESEISRSAAKERRELYSHLSKLRARNIDLERREKSVKLEMEDGAKFISHLHHLLEELENSATAYVTLGGIEFSHCPSCFSLITEKEKGCCHLCGNEFTDEQREAKALQVKLDFEGQIKESITLQSEREEEVSEITMLLRKNRSAFTRGSKRLNELESLPVDGRTALVSSLSRSIGNLDARIAELLKLTEIAKELAALSEEKVRLNGEVTRLNDRITALENSQKKRRRQVFTAIAESTKYFLRKDMQEHTDFDKLDDFAFSFEDDWFAVNGNPNISTSASGMVMLKNCLMLGIMKSALHDPRMIFPRFLIQDNGEDKGMVSDRVRHFQEMMAEWSDEQTKQHQIILTTSTLNPELDSEEYLIGQKYTKDNKTLNFSGSHLS